MELTTLETGLTIAGTFFSTALTLGRYMRITMTEMSRKIDHLSQTIANLDRKIAEHGVIINLLKERLK